MSDRSKTEFTGIEWTDKSWNPVTGCTKVSAGCKFCYAETLSKRLKAMGNPRYTNGFQVTLHGDKVTEPVGWRKPLWVFVNSMSDLLHKDIPDAFVMDVVHTMAVRAPQHRYQWLTKRAERFPEISRLVMDKYGAWPRNILPGVSVEDHRVRHRIDLLGQVGDEHTVRKLSVEPLIGSVCPDGDVLGFAEQLERNRIGWVITGGEAGFKARPADLDWFRQVRDACELADVAYFHKQHGGAGVTKEVKRGGKLATLDGVLHHQMPVVWHATPHDRPRFPALREAQPSLL